MNAIEKHILVAKALSDKNRIRVLFALEQGELCACDIIELLRIVPSTVSKHMGILIKAGLVEGRKDGRWMYYSLAGNEKSLLTKKMLRLTINSLRKDSVIVRDSQRLKAIHNRCDQRKCETEKQKSRCGCKNRGI